MAQIQRIRIKLRGYDAKVVDQAAQSIIETTVRTGAKISGPVPLPVKREVYAVNKSPHVYKRSMEHFETRTHKRLIDIIDPTAKTIDSLQHLQVPAGVDIQIS
jgi:small subunit ribosomal protein S10